jgi:hypothetical protein
MPLNIIEKLAQLEGIDKLPEISPNTQDVPGEHSERKNRLVQAIIPSILAGFYKFTRNEQFAAEISDKNNSRDWLDILFGPEKKNLMKRIAIYSGSSEDEAGDKMQQISANAIHIITGEMSKADGKTIKNYFTAQRNNILHHLPAAIEIGNILNDTTLDDRTNKMSGPVSGLMHGIEKTFASTDSEKNKDNESKF